MSSPSIPFSIALFAFTVAGIQYLVRNRKRKEKKLVKYLGSCHCKGVTFSVQAPSHLVAWNCNCSICYMKKNWHFIVPSLQFTLISGEELLTEYTFNTKVARHKFCKVCGVQAYYHPRYAAVFPRLHLNRHVCRSRSNPDGIAVTLACIRPDALSSFEIREFDGTNWEDFYAVSNIKTFSALS